MLRMFWSIVVLQVLVVVGFASVWPESRSMWLVAVLFYVVSSYKLFDLGLQIGKQDKVYYLFTVAGTSFNWVVFGAIGVGISFLLSVFNIPFIS